MTLPTVPPYELTFTVTSTDIDERDHVNNVVYVQWVNDAAIAHWRSAATAEQQAEVAWVLIHHEIDYKISAVLGDRITARTWVGAAEGISFERFVELIRTSDGKLLAHSRTLWCPVDAGTGRPRRVPPAIRERFSVHPT
ncbi:MAG: acyl-CoA thioesterase [Gemmatimonadales bacterium]